MDLDKEYKKLLENSLKEVKQAEINPPRFCERCAGDLKSNEKKLCKECKAKEEKIYKIMNLSQTAKYVIELKEKYESIPKSKRMSPEKWKKDTIDGQAFVKAKALLEKEEKGKKVNKELWELQDEVSKLHKKKIYLKEKKSGTFDL